MRYFDQKIIAKLFATERDVLVSDGKRFLSVVDMDDLWEKYLIGVSSSGRSYKIRYEDIEIVKVGNEFFTLEMLRTGTEPKSTDELPNKVDIPSVEYESKFIKNLREWYNKK